jgi:Rad3-related DNA helicase
MQSIEISNVNVKFPFVPYKQQYGLMDTLIRGAQEAKNSLVDSPTGTGKTLCLITSMLAWLECYKAWKKAILNPEYDDAQLKPLHLAAFGDRVPYLKDRRRMT